MAEIQRYKFDDDYCMKHLTDECEASMEHDPNGEYVLFADHQAAIAKAKSDVWDTAIQIVKDLLPELEELNRVESLNGFIGTSYELGQTKDIVEMLEAAKKAEE